MSVERDVDVSLADDGDTAIATVVERRELLLDDLFQDGELRLWEDSEGWNGFLREESDDAVVYYSVNCLEGSPEEEWLRKTRVGERAVREGVRAHIEDARAGGAGNFVRRCSPP